MESEKYGITWNNNDFAFDFYSEGPNGKIKKQVRFQPMRHLGENAFNVALGDQDETTGQFDDLTIRNNNDRQKSKFMLSKASSMIPKKVDIILADSYPLIKVDDPAKYENDPFFVKKLEEAYKALKECPIPDWLLNKAEKKPD